MRVLWDKTHQQTTPWGSHSNETQTVSGKQLCCRRSLSHVFDARNLTQSQASPDQAFARVREPQTSEAGVCRPEGAAVQEQAMDQHPSGLWLR